MKALLAGAFLGVSLAIVGCASTKPPSAFEEHFFTVITNYVTVVTTNEQISAGPDGVLVTNPVIVTNIYEGYDFAPNTNATALIETGERIGDFWGVGGLVGTILAGLFGVWARMRGNQAQKTAGVLAQVIEAGRKILATTPQGQGLETQWVAWMSKHQTETGVVLEVAKLLKQVVDKDTAQMVADELIKMAQKGQAKK
jgi:hypothetical protein